MASAAVESRLDTASGAASASWPRKVDVFGVRVSVTDYESATSAILNAAAQHTPSVVSCHAAHAIVTISNDPALCRRVNQFEMITPDGQPVRWAMNHLHRAALADRVYGPELTLRLCRGAAARGIGVYLYGGDEQVLVSLRAGLLRQFPTLQIVGAHAPPFRPLTSEEDVAVVADINASGAGLVFIGLGCPKQDVFASEHRDRIQAVQVCVGAAFDFHAGRKKSAPRWMQRRGLEWLYRLVQEPKRLWKRYLVTNTQFVWKWNRAYWRRNRQNPQTD